MRGRQRTHTLCDDALLRCIVIMEEGELIASIARTGEEFLEFLRAVAASSDPSTPYPTPVEAFLGAHPKALEFVQAPKPVPSSFARESYFGITAMRSTNRDGISRYGRYRIVPEAGNDYLDPATASTKGANFLFDELNFRAEFRGFCSASNLAHIVNQSANTCMNRGCANPKR